MTSSESKNTKLEIEEFKKYLALNCQSLNNKRPIKID